MEMQTDNGVLNVPDGTAVIFVDTFGKMLGAFRVEGGDLKDMMRDVPAPHDPTKEEHSEISLHVANVPASSGAPRVLAADTVRLCRNKFGNVVPCPPR